MFTGFDELWIFAMDPVVDLEHLPPLTTDALDLSDSPPDEISTALVSTGCLLAVGDGDWLNYVTRDASLHDMIAASGQRVNAH